MGIAAGVTAQPGLPVSRGSSKQAAMAGRRLAPCDYRCSFVSFVVPKSSVVCGGASTRPQRELLAPGRDAFLGVDFHQGTAEAHVVFRNGPAAGQAIQEF